MRLPGFHLFTCTGKTFFNSYLVPGTRYPVCTQVQYVKKPSFRVPSTSDNAGRLLYVGQMNLHLHVVVALQVHALVYSCRFPIVEVTAGTKYLSLRDATLSRWLRSKRGHEISSLPRCIQRSLVCVSLLFAAAENQIQQKAHYEQ